MPLVVLFDGGCPMCRHLVRRLHTLDWLRKLRFVDGTNARLRGQIAPGLTEADVFTEMYVVDPSGARYGGYDGFQRLARVIPLLWPFVALRALPGNRRIGRRVYQWVAANRTRRGRCTDDFCES